MKTGTTSPSPPSLSSPESGINIDGHNAFFASGVKSRESADVISKTSKISTWTRPRERHVLWKQPSISADGERASYKSSFVVNLGVGTFRGPNVVWPLRVVVGWIVSIRGLSGRLLRFTGGGGTRAAVSATRPRRFHSAVLNLLLIPVVNNIQRCSYNGVRAGERVNERTNERAVHARSDNSVLE